MPVDDKLDLTSEPETNEKKTVLEQDFHPDKEKLKLARQVLLSLGVVFIISPFSYCFDKEFGKAIFEIVSHGVPPIVTLILGYYFSKT